MQAGESLERTVRDRLAAGDADGAVEAVLRGYGPEVFGFLVVALGDRGEAGEVFSVFAEDAWKGLARFDFREASLRTWLYVVARHAAARHRRRARPEHVPLSQTSAVARLAAQVRSETDSSLRRSRLQELRDSLPADDRELLILRIDRGLAWNEVARIMLAQEHPSADELKTESARLRKRLQLVKERLREAARKAGLTAG